MIYLKKINAYIYKLIPPGLTSSCKPLDISINKPFKDHIKQKYRDFVLPIKILKPTPDYIIKWVSEVWWSDHISENIIKNSFKKAGLNLKLNGSEDLAFNWPKQSDMILIEDLPSLKKNNEINSFNYNFIKNDESEEEIEDYLFDSNRYRIENIRKQVINDLKKTENDIEMDDCIKDYDYYQAFDYFK